MVIWFWGILVSAMTFIIVGEKQKAEHPVEKERPSQVVQVDGGESGWKKSADGNTEVRVYWDNK